MDGSTDSQRDATESLLEDEWVRDVTKMGIGWLIGTVIGIVLLVFVGPMVF